MHYEDYAFSPHDVTTNHGIIIVVIIIIIIIVAVVMIRTALFYLLHVRFCYSFLCIRAQFLMGFWAVKFAC
jgi:hypothetical protein